jgi:Fe-S-cluster containining protein
MPSLCDTCARPGSCCKGFGLATGLLERGTAEEVDALLADGVTCTNTDGGGSFLAGCGAEDHARACADVRLANVRRGLPFRRLFRTQDGRWQYWCPNLQRDGRCGDYANRPAACHALQPGSGKPCCLSVPGIAPDSNPGELA